jgi:lantibiotic modifying enzyme
LLDVAPREHALAVVKAIIDSLRADWPPSEDRTEVADPSLAGGAAGLAVLFAYRAVAHSGTDDEAAADRWLDRAIDAVSDQPMEASLYGGLTGVGWAATHVGKLLPNLVREDVNEEIDETLLEHLGQSPWPDEYDLIGGLVGIGVYALERLAPGADATRLAAVACLERVIDHLAQTAQHQPEGITWWTDPAWLIPETREKFPRGYYNLGLAHGVPGVIALLGCACAAGVAEDKARPLLDGAVRWLLAQQMTEGPAAFSSFVGPDIPPAPARLAWCYGDLGLTVALLWAARCVGEADWERAALAVARRAVEWPAGKSGVVDAGLCHGAAGVGHLFNRLFQATGERCFAEAARLWFERTLALRQPGRGIAGYLSWSPGADGAMTWLAESGLLTGGAGVALALLAAATPIEPTWDRMLLASVPPR